MRACAIDGRPSLASKHAPPIKEVWKWTLIWMGDPALADESLIPDHSLVHMDDPERTADVGGMAMVRSRRMLLHESILDLNHLTYLHATTVGSPRIASTKARTTDIPNGIRVVREVMGETLDGTVIGA